MSQYPEPAPYGASGAYGGGPTPRRRERPRAGWFVAAGLLIVLGAGLAISALVLSISAFTRVDAQLPPDGVTRSVSVESGTAYLLWRRPGAPLDCRVFDGETRSELPTSGLGSTSYTRDTGSGSWEGARTFVARSAAVEVSCSTASGPVEIGEKPAIHTLVGGILLGLVVPILATVLGFALLIVVAVLYATGAPRTTAD